MKLAFFLTLMTILALSIFPVYSGYRVGYNIPIQGKFAYHLWSILFQNEQKGWEQKKSREKIAQEKGYDSWYSYMEKEGPRWPQSGLMDKNAHIAWLMLTIESIINHWNILFLSIIYLSMSCICMENYVVTVTVM